MNTVHCTPSCDWVQFVAPFSLLPKPQKTVFLGVGTEQVRSRYGEGTELVSFKVRSLLID